MSTLAPIDHLTVDGRTYQVFGKNPEVTPHCWHDLTWVVFAKPMQGDPTEAAGGIHRNAYPSRSVVPIQSVMGWLGLSAVNVTASPPYREGWAVLDESAYQVFGYAETVQGAWRAAAESMTAQLAARYAQPVLRPAGAR